MGTVKKGLGINKKAFLTEQVSSIIQCKTLLKYKDPGSPTISVNIGGTCIDKVDNFYYPVDFVVLDTEQMAESTHQVPIILGRPFFATANAIINFWNGVMQLTFGNMNLELNIFHLSNKDNPAEDKEQKLEEVCQSGTSEGRANIHKLQKELIENQEAVDEGSTASVSLPASDIPPTPLDSIMLDIQEQKLDSTTVHLTASTEELLLLYPP